MRPSIRAAVLVAAVGIPLALVSPAQATGGQGTIVLPGTEQCVDYNSGKVEYNNGNPTMEPATLKVYNCAT
jgi:hypothetical protein